MKKPDEMDVAYGKWMEAIRKLGINLGEPDDLRFAFGMAYALGDVAGEARVKRREERLAEERRRNGRRGGR